MTAAQGLQEKIRAVLVKRISAGDREVPEFADDEDLLTSGVLDKLWIPSTSLARWKTSLRSKSRSRRWMRREWSPLRAWLKTWSL